MAKMRHDQRPEKAQLLADGHSVRTDEAVSMLDLDAVSKQSRNSASRRGQRDETEMQLRVGNERRDEELALLVNEPHTVIEAPDGSGNQVDMRPPELQVKVAEKDYSDFYDAGLYLDAVRRLVARMAYAKLANGKEHVAVVKAQLTLAKAYLELQHLPKQALKHTEEAYTLFTTLKRTNQLTANPVSRMLLEAELLAMLGTCCCRLAKTTAELSVAEQHFRHAVITYAQIAGRRDCTLEQNVTRGMGEVCAKQRKFALAAEYLRHAVKLVLKANGPNDHELIVLYQQLGAAESHLDNEAQAADAFTKVQKLQHGAESVEIAEASLVHAKALIRLGKESAAEAELTKALAIYFHDIGGSIAEAGPYTSLMIEGHNHGDAFREVSSMELRVLQIQDELAGVLIRSARYNPAVKILKNLLVSKCWAFGTESLAVAKGNRLLGNVRLAEGKVKLGISCLRTAEKIFLKELGAAHSKTRAVQQTLKALM